MSDLVLSVANTPVTVLQNQPPAKRAYRALSAALRWEGRVQEALQASLMGFEYDEDGHDLWGYHHEVIHQNE